MILDSRPTEASDAIKREAASSSESLDGEIFVEGEQLAEKREQFTPVKIDLEPEAKAEPGSGVINEVSGQPTAEGTEANPGQTYNLNPSAASSEKLIEDALKNHAGEMQNNSGEARDLLNTLIGPGESKS